MSIGVAIAGGLTAASNRKRSTNDFYPTPVEVTLALARQYDMKGLAVWEPCCGDGAMARVLDGHADRVVCSDIAPQMDGATTADFLAASEMMDGTNAIITNPPFNLAEAFIAHARSLQPEFFALVLKATFWHAARRAALFRSYPPSAIHPLLWRPDFLGLGAPTMDICWVVWAAPGAGLPTRYIPMERPS
jgi:hypothetical protein